MLGGPWETAMPKWRPLHPEATGDDVSSQLVSSLIPRNTIESAQSRGYLCWAPSLMQGVRLGGRGCLHPPFPCGRHFFELAPLEFHSNST